MSRLPPIPATLRILSACCALLLLVGASPRAVAAPPARCQRWQTFGPGNGFPSAVVHAIVEDRDGLWFATNAGLARRGADRWQLLSRRDGLPHSVVWDAALSPNGDLWLATPGGLARVSGGRVDTFRTAQSGLPADVVYDVALEGARYVWTATAAGLARLDLYEMAWEHRSGPRAGQLPLGGTSELLLDPRGLVVGTFGHGAWRRGERSFEPIAAEAASGSGPWGSLLAPTAIAREPGSDRLVIGSARGLGVFEGGSLRTVPLPVYEGQPARVLSLAASNGRIFVGTDRGLSVLDGTRWTHYRPAPESDPPVAQVVSEGGDPAAEEKSVRLRTFLPAAPVRAIHVQGDELWIGTGRGLGHCTPGAPVAPPRVRRARVRRLPTHSTPPPPTDPRLRPADRGRQPAPLRRVRIGVALPPEGRDPVADAFVRGARRYLAAAGAARTWGRRLYPYELEVARAPEPWPGEVASAASRLLWQRKVRVVLAPEQRAGEGELGQVARAFEAPVLHVGASSPVSGELPFLSLSAGLGPAQQVTAALTAAGSVPARLTLVTLAEADLRTQEVRAAAERAGAAVEVVRLPSARSERSAALEELAARPAGAVLLWLPHGAALAALRALRPGGIGPACYGPARLGTAALVEEAQGAAEGCVFALPGGFDVPVDGGGAGRSAIEPWDTAGYEALRWVVDRLEALRRIDRADVALALHDHPPAWASRLGAAQVRGGRLVPLRRAAPAPSGSADQ